jgi:chromosome segregation ATPase
MENVTDSDIFINAYLKKQEDFTVEVIRKRLEAEVKIQLLQTELQKVLAEKTSLEDMVKQSLSGLEGITLERDKYKTKVSDLESKLEKDTRALRDININNQTLIDDLKVQVKSYSTLKSDYETLKNNYDRVCTELNKVSEKPVTKKKSKKEQESEWIDGNEIST